MINKKKVGTIKHLLKDRTPYLLKSILERRYLTYLLNNRVNNTRSLYEIIVTYFKQIYYFNRIEFDTVYTWIQNFKML